MADLALRQMVLYKHGVGFFVRRGAVSGEGISLTFREEEINDILKSLTVFDRAGGRVLGIDYQTPMDKAARLASSSIRLGEHTSQLDLLRDLRGRQVTITVESAGGALEAVDGRVIGVDIPPARPTNMSGPYLTPMVSVAADDGQVRFFPLDTLRGLVIHDAQSTQDLSYFLDTNMQEDNRRSVHVRLTEGDHDLVVQYVAPSPTWRVSYRVVAESDEGGASGRALIQGWGLFDNRLEEDLEDVSLTLVAGQPISFIYDLYESRIPQRPVVKDEARVAPGPIKVAGAAASPPATLKRAAPQLTAAFSATRDEAEEVVEGLRMQSARGTGARMADVAESTGAIAQVEASGEFFEYRVATPVSVKRGESAMAPILGTEISYQRELVYNGAKLPSHPVAALRFMNATGLTLESGPVTVSEDGDYRGEAVVPFTKDGGEVYLPYAVELGVTVTEKPSYSTRTIGLMIKRDLLIHQQHNVMSVEYVIENTTADELVVAIEASVDAQREPFDMPAPDAETARERRWRVSAPARGRISFVRQERARVQSSEYLRGLRFEKLQEYLENKWLDRKTFDALSGLLDVLRSIERMQGEIAQIKEQRQQLFEQQAQLRENLNALHGGGDEIALHGRMVNRLEKTQDQLDALEMQESSLETQIQQAEAQADQIVAGLPQASDE